MEFLDKLYASNYFGIGLFIVISFLVVTFLVVLFLGKKDEKKRKIEETNKINIVEDTVNAFKETSVETPIEMPIMPELEPVAPIEQTPIMPINPFVEEPVHLESVPLQPVSPISLMNDEAAIPTVQVEPVAPINIESVQPITPVIPTNEDIVTPIVPDMSNNELQPVMPVNFEEPIEKPIVVENIDNTEPKKEENIINSIAVEPINNIEPVILEPIKIDIPFEPMNVEPIIKEEIIPVNTPVIEPTPIIDIQPATEPNVEEPVTRDAYYDQIEKVQTDEIKVPNIDFEALANSISKELDELEKSTNSKYEDIQIPNEQTNRPTNQFSSVYINEPVKPVLNKPIDLPNKIDLPTLKSEEIEPESYNI